MCNYEDIEDPVYEHQLSMIENDTVRDIMRKVGYSIKREIVNGTDNEFKLMHSILNEINKFSLAMAYSYLKEKADAGSQ